MTTTKAPVSGQALRLAREQKRISQRELGRRVALRLGNAGAARAIQMRLSRIEKGDEISEADRDLLDALAAELAVGADDLAEPPLWVWIKLHNGRPGMVELALRFPVYTSPERAYQARDWLAHASKGHFTPFEGASLVPMRAGTLRQDVLDENYPQLSDDERRLLVAVDPDEDTLPYLAGLNEVLNTDKPEDWAMASIVSTIDKFDLAGEILKLHKLALRRLLRAADDVPDDLIRSWLLREQRLDDLLEVYHALRRQQREEALAKLGISVRAEE